MKKKRSIKKIIIALIILIIVVLGLAFTVAFRELHEEDILKQEIINYSNKDLATDDYSIEVKTTGDRAYVEETVKKYYRSLSNSVKAINYYLSNDDLINILTIENLKSDNPTFENSHKIINDSKSKINKEFNNISSLCEEDTIKNLLDTDKLSDPEYYYDFYLNLMYTEKDIEELSNVKQYMETLSSHLNSILDKMDEILTFLETNKDYIVYTDTLVTFTDQNILNEYNTLSNELTTLTSSIPSTESDI